MMIRRLSAYTTVFLIVAGCATSPPPPTPMPTSDTSERSFDEAVNVATDGLMAQMQKRPGLSTKKEDKLGVVIDPMVDAASGQQSGATRLLEERVADRLRSNYSQFDVVPFQVANLSTAQFLLTGTMTRVASGQPGARQVFQIDLALTDLKTGMVVAQASSRARDEALDTSPTPYYRDSPILVKDKVVDGYISTSKTPPGQAADPVYFERVATATIISEATLAYNKESYQDALGLYRNAAATPSGEQLRVLNGIYLASWKLGRANEAEEAFGKVVALGLNNNNLGAKFLFNPGTTDFWSDPQVSGPYGLWLRQIARQAVATKVCMNVVGHTSLTGSESYNDRLSQRRAAYIKQRLDTEAPELASRTRAAGMGFRENIVGTGTDDARDALDRRVEFKITEC
jgi:outer membrane protein OmpA-like peptidoglycan-associated protein